MAIDKKLGYLLFLVSRAHHNLANRVFKEIDLFRGQPPVLFELGKHDGITQSELASNLELTQATITNMLRRMEASGLIMRSRDPSDARFSRIYLTEIGKDKLTQATELAKKMDRIAFADFSSEEKDLMYALLGRVHSNLIEE